METITLSSFLVTLIASYIIPLITALVTKFCANAGVKQLVSGGLAVVTGLITNKTMLDGSAIITKEAILFAALSFITANVAYLGTWKPHEIDVRLAPDRGLG